VLGWKRVIEIPCGLEDPLQDIEKWSGGCIPLGKRVERGKEPSCHRVLELCETIDELVYERNLLLTQLGELLRGQRKVRRQT
jgi:hypothetical protein